MPIFLGQNCSCNAPRSLLRLQVSQSGFELLLSDINATAGIAQPPDPMSGLALYADFSGAQAQWQPVSQIVLLPPGTYDFQTQYRGEIVARRGLVWRMSCADKASEKLGETPPVTGKVPRWTGLSFSVTIPQTGCRAQILKLDLDARSASEAIVSGTMWFDEITLKRTARAAQTPDAPAAAP
jgi:hypothetical protein